MDADGIPMCTNAGTEAGRSVRYKLASSSRREVDMTRLLIVAHEGVTNPTLRNMVRDLVAEDQGVEFDLLVPATPIQHLLFRHPRGTDPELVARQRVEDARAAFAEWALPLVDAVVGPPDPLEGIEAAVRAHPDYAGFVISTLPQERSRWLRMHLPRKVRKMYGLPVHEVEMSVGELAQRMLP
jgi:hypothetical protein